MNTTDTQTPAVVRPSRLVAVVMGPLTKVRAYVTPAGARLTGDTFVIPLTFGNTSDWSRNVRAAGGCTIVLNGTGYRAVQPEFADRDQAAPVVRAAFGPIERAMFRMLGIHQYLLLRRADS